MSAPSDAPPPATTPRDVGSAVAPTTPGNAPPGRETVGSYVRRRIGALLAQVDSSGTRASLAALRNAVAQEPGSVPAIWGLTVDGVPGAPRDDAPTRQERAVHLAMTLFAVHQQSRPQPMHARGVGLGHAIRRLERSSPTRGDGDVSPVRRRFDALASATNLSEAAHHLRGIVGQLRSEGIPLDYGALADDLESLQDTSRAAGVRLRWARQYYRTDTHETTTSPAQTQETPL